MIRITPVGRESRPLAQLVQGVIIVPRMKQTWEKCPVPKEALAFTYTEDHNENFLLQRDGC